MNVYALFPMFFLVFSACGRDSGSSDLFSRELPKEKLLADFAQMAEAFRGLYGPMEYKTARPDVKLNFEELVNSSVQAIQAAKTEEEAFGVFTQFTAKFKDGHVGITFPISQGHVASYEIPIFLDAVKDKDGKWVAVVDHVDDSIKDAGIKVGDIIVSVDGKPTFDYLETIKKYKSYSNDVSDRHLIYRVFRRDSFMTELVPTSVLAKIVYQRAGKEEAEASTTTLAWKKNKDQANFEDFVVPTKAQQLYFSDAIDMNLQAGASLKKIGAPEPFFFTEKVQEKYKMKRRRPTTESLKKFGLEEKDAAPIFAATYEYEGKDILLIRQPGYVPPVDSKVDDEAIYYEAIKKWIQTYKAVLYENSDVDVLIVDQNHNPGGISSYAFDFFRLLINSQKASLIQRNNVDRKWIINYLDEAKRFSSDNRPAEARRSTAFARMMEEAEERGDLLSEPVTFDYDYFLAPHEDFTWKKTVLILADELAGSCGDIFPMLVKNNGVAKIFGERTMGLGGNVETLELTHSRAKVRLTRGLFTTYREDGNYTDDVYIENNGVIPDVHYEHNLEDLRAGFVQYVEEFSKVAVAQ